MEDNRDSFVLFQIVSDLAGRQYKDMVRLLIVDSLKWLDPEIHPEWARRMACDNWNQEGWIGSTRVKGQYINHLKIFLLDDNPPSKYSAYPKSIIFHDHYSPVDVEKVYLVADAFEAFLKERRIEYFRHNRERN